MLAKSTHGTQVDMRVMEAGEPEGRQELEA